MTKDPQDLLRQELLEAKDQLADLDKQLQHRPDFGLGVGSPDIVTWEMNLARRNVLQARISEIQEALARSASGDYGVCEVCGVTIDPERLRILPHTRRCVRCAGIRPGTRLPSRPRQAV